MCIDLSSKKLCDAQRFYTSVTFFRASDLLRNHAKVFYYLGNGSDRKFLARVLSLQSIVDNTTYIDSASLNGMV